MQYQSLLTWGLAASLALGVAAPVLAAKGDVVEVDGRASIKLTVTSIADRDDLQVFQAWYGQQMREYGNTDPDTGERLADLVQMVVEVSDNKLMVSDQQGLRRGVILTKRTQVTFDDEDFRRPEPGRKRTAPFPERRGIADIRPGDLVIAQGYLRSGGGIVATTLRVVGRTHGYGYDDRRDARPGYGTRLWGEVTLADTRRDRLEVMTNVGRRTITLDRDGAMLANGREVTLSYCRRGDRVIVYTNDRIDDTFSAYRIVILSDNDRYPDGDRPCWADPDGRDGGQVDRTMLEGRLQSLATGAFFNMITVELNNGRNATVRFAKTVQAVDRDGREISLYNLRNGQRLRIEYTDIAGTLFAERIELY